MAAARATVTDIIPMNTDIASTSRTIRTGIMKFSGVARVGDKAPRVYTCKPLR